VSTANCCAYVIPQPIQKTEAVCPIDRTSSFQRFCVKVVKVNLKVKSKWLQKKTEQAIAFCWLIEMQKS